LDELVWTPSGESPAGLRLILAEAPADQQADLLVDLVADHLAPAWAAGAGGPRIEAYLAEFGGQFAEFRSAATVPAELVEAEFLARHAAVEFGDHPPLDEYRQRFPDCEDVWALPFPLIHSLASRQEWRTGLFYRSCGLGREAEAVSRPSTAPWTQRSRPEP